MRHDILMGATRYWTPAMPLADFLVAAFDTGANLGGGSIVFGQFQQVDVDWGLYQDAECQNPVPGVDGGSTVSLSLLFETDPNGASKSGAKMPLLQLSTRYFLKLAPSAGADTPSGVWGGSLDYHAPRGPDTRHPSHGGQHAALHAGLFGG